MLTVHFKGPIDGTRAPTTPALTEVGLRVAAEGPARLLDGTASLRLRLAFRFPKRLWEAYHDLGRAVVLEVEDPASGQSATSPLIDPTIKPATPIDKNWKGFPPGEPGKYPDARTGYAGVALSIAGLDAPATVFVRASLREHVSNTLAVDLATGAVRDA